MRVGLCNAYLKGGTVGCRAGLFGASHRGVVQEPSDETIPYVSNPVWAARSQAGRGQARDAASGSGQETRAQALVGVRSLVNACNGFNGVFSR